MMLRLGFASAVVGALLATGPVTAAGYTWTGANSSLWSDPGNWIGGSPAGDPNANLGFPRGAIRLTSTNDLPGVTYAMGISVSEGYTLDSLPGSSLALAQGIGFNGWGTSSISIPITLYGGTSHGIGGSGGLMAAQGSLVVSGGISGGPPDSIGITGTRGFTVVLAGTNSFSGSVTVQDTNLEVDGSLAASMVTVRTLNTFGRLLGTGSIDGDVSLVPGSIIWPELRPGTATSTGVLSVGGVLQGSLGVLGFRLNGLAPGAGYDQLSVGSFHNDGFQLSVSAGFVPPLGSVFTIIDGTSPFSGIDDWHGTIRTSNCLAFELNHTATSVFLTHVAYTPPPLTVSISSSGGQATYCNGTGGTASVSDSGGCGNTHQWGFRTVSGGAITDIGGETGTNYVIRGEDFPGPGTYFLVERSTPTGGSPVTSNELTITVLPPLPGTVTASATTILAGESVQLQATGGSACSWSPTAGISDPSSCSPVATPTTTTTYVVTFSGYCSPSNQPSVTITVVDRPTTITTLAGQVGKGGWFDGIGSAARLRPLGVAVDATGNTYVADGPNHTIRRISAGGTVSTLAGLAGSIGSADGTGASARFNNPYGVAVDGRGYVFVADTGNHTIRQVSPAGVVSTLAGLAGSSGFEDGTGSAARFDGPRGIAIDSAGNVYVADWSNHTIRRISPSGVVSTLAGLARSPGSADEAGTAARFRFPAGVAVDGTGTTFVADSGNHTLRKVTSAGVVSTIAGLPGNPGSSDGIGASSRFSSPKGVAVDSAGVLYIADEGNSAIRTVSPTAVVATLAGLAGSPGSADGSGTVGRFEGPHGIAVSTAGTVIVGDHGNNAVRSVTSEGVVSTLAGLAGGAGSTDGSGSAARFDSPSGIAVDSSGNVYAADGQNTIRKISSLGEVTTFAGLAGSAGSADGTGSGARFSNPNGTAADAQGNIYVADTYNHTIRKVTPAGVVSTVAGMAGTPGSQNGSPGNSQFDSPRGVAVDPSGVLYVADTGNHTIRRVVPGVSVSLVAGSAGVPGSDDGHFNSPLGIAVDGSGNLYVADTFNHAIRKILPDGAVSTLAGLPGVPGYVDATGTSARFNYPRGIVVDGSGYLRVADASNNVIRDIAPTGVVSTRAGVAESVGNIDGTSAHARFSVPWAIATTMSGDLYIADFSNDNIRRGAAGLFDAATIDSPAGPINSPRILGTTPDTATSWMWEIVRRPAGGTAELSSATTRTPSFTPDIEGLWVFRLTATGAGGLQSITFVDFSAICSTVASPSVSSSENPSCSGKPVVLAASPGFSSYVWSTGEQTQSITVAPTLSTAYTVKGYVGACESATVNYVQEVSPPSGGPGATNNGPLCEGGTLQLSAGYVTGATYSWTGPNGFTSTLQNPTIGSVTTAASGTYSVTMTVDSCISSPSTTSVTVNGKPTTPVITAPSSATTGQTGLAASVASHAGSSYQWSISNGSITGGQGSAQITFTAGGAGILALFVAETNAAGCVSGTGSAALPVAGPAVATKLFTLTPCRAVDTRFGAGSLAGPALVGTAQRVFPVAASSCGIPVTARALSVNVTVTQAGADGDLRFYPGDGAVPLASTINFRAGQTRANNAVLPLSTDGQGSIGVQNDAPSSVHLIVDVNGYFE